MRALLTVSLIAAMLLIPTPTIAGDELKPVGDYNKLTKEMRRVPRDERDAELKRRALEYLEAWKASGREAKGSELYAIAQFQQDAGLLKDSADGYGAVRKDESAKQKIRDFAATAQANLLTFAEYQAEVGMDAIDKTTKELEAYAEAMAEQDRQRSRGKLRSVLAILHSRAGRTKDSRALRMKIIQADSKAVGKHVRPIMRGLLSEAHKKDAYAALRKEAEGVHKSIVDIQSAVLMKAKGNLEGARAKLLAASPDALAEDGSLKQTDRKKQSRLERSYSSAKRSYDSADTLLKSLPAYLESFDLLGKPAPAWTLEKSYTDGIASLENVKGKVVVLDFWNTWGPNCSFPVIRDLLRDYGEKGLTVVGVTASSSMVFASRFDYDDDHRSKSKGEKQYAARLASERRPANGDYILEEEPYRAREIEVIGTFIENHEMTWPVVMIDKDEPAAKYAQDTWPHTVILDKQGCIRFIRGGVLSRDKTAIVANVKKVIEDLLGE